MREPDDVALAYYVTVEVCGVIREALVDTGASLTMASDTLLASLPNYDLRPASVNVITCVSGTTLDIVGELYLSIKVDRLTSQPHRIIIVRDSSSNFPFILGLDFLDRHCISVDTSERRLNFQSSDGIESNIDLTVGRPDKPQSRVVCCWDTDVDPRSRRLLEARVCKGIDGTTGSLEPFQLHESRLLIASSVNTVTSGKILIEVLNTSEEVVTIKKNRKLGTFVPLQEANINVLHTSDSEVNGVFSKFPSDLRWHRPDQSTETDIQRVTN